MYLEFMIEEQDKLLIKTGKLLIFCEYNYNDTNFMSYFNKHFNYLREKGYETEISFIENNTFMLQLSYGIDKITRPEILYLGRKWKKY